MTAPRYDRELARAAETLTPSNLRDPESARRLNRERHAQEPHPAALEHCLVEDSVVPTADGEVAIRMYRPRRLHEPAPAVVWLHGGAFILGDLDASDALCARMAERVGGSVVNVDYRLAPEHPAPAGLDDGYAVLRWVAEHAGTLGVDATRIAVAGSSAGGCLAAGIALLARDRGGPDLAYQLLVCPVLDDRRRSVSARTVVDVPVFTADSNAVMWEIYLNGREADGYLAPARTEDLANLPPTYLLVAQHDPLRDEALDYGQRLVHAGVDVELDHVPGTYHGFDAVVPDAAISRRVTERYLDALARALAGERWD